MEKSLDETVENHDKYFNVFLCSECQIEINKDKVDFESNVLLLLSRLLRNGLRVDLQIFGMQALNRYGWDPTFVRVDSISDYASLSSVTQTKAARSFDKNV